MARERSALHGRNVADERDDFEVPPLPAAVPAEATQPLGVAPPRKQAGGWADPKQLPRGANGLPLCRKCGLEIEKGSGRAHLLLGRLRGRVEDPHAAGVRGRTSARA